ncbi:extracellular solute-binding protein [Desulfobotulus mexicanus]|uniref:ABC transporter substrate-binding protein n=1 Tax=Desulfobotulus mexicanus TaxID=2586642 RepID=A0A5S5MFB8_9BACT|nr:extracellular solute-binding protein [Desulfobotulus mexicanus]TYT74394.1 ABC transporter substrate-binding protein [Desulfobotulus mexicanus]
MRLNLICMLLIQGLYFITPVLAAPSHGIALWGEPQYGTDFTHFAYARPDAPKGGHLRMAATGSFDSFHPFTIRGTAAAGVGLLYETLMTASLDEPSSSYGLIAGSVSVSEDRTSVTFRLRPEARFHDGHPVLAEDVVFSFQILIREGSPHYRKYYEDITGVHAPDEHTVRFDIRPGSAMETPYILGQLPVLPAHVWKEREFSRSSLETPVGSGPYRIHSFDAGRRITYIRDKDYWGWHLPVNQGHYNFDFISWEYFRDATVSLEAFKAGVFDYRLENTAKTWATLYDGPAFRDGRIRKETIPHERPQGMQGFVFNIRKPVFRDRAVRKALSLVFDFEWANTHLFYGQYSRSHSFFQNSPMAAEGFPSEEELVLLEPFRHLLPESAFGTAIVPPVTDGSGNIRPLLREADRILNEAGWILKGGKRIHKETGRPLSFEILLASPSFQRIAMPFRQNLARLGVDASVRVVDRTRYVRQLQDFNYDMIVGNFRQSHSPGSEQRDFWSSEAASVPGGRNTIGIADPVVDALVEHILNAENREELITACRALDRVLRASHYVIPQWFNASYRIAYWDKLRHPEKSPEHGLGIYTWWIDTEAEARLTPGAVMHTEPGGDKK